MPEHITHEQAREAYEHVEMGEMSYWMEVLDRYIVQQSTISPDVGALIEDVKRGYEEVVRFVREREAQGEHDASSPAGVQAETVTPEAPTKETEDGVSDVAGVVRAGGATGVTWAEWRVLKAKRRPPSN